MIANELAMAKDPDLRAALGALRRAAQAARKTAMQTGTHLVIVEHGRLQRVSAAELAQQEANKPSPA
jgi:Cdc6-like AAA superfamily ATPase